MKETLTPAEIEEARNAILAKCVLVGDCWLWTGAKNSSGYGVARIGGSVHTVSRFMLHCATGKPMSTRLEACHKDGICPYKTCCNPRHLFWASKSDNAKARQRRAKAQLAVFQFWESFAWVDGVFQVGNSEAQINRCIKGIEKHRSEQCSTPFEEYLGQGTDENPFVLLADTHAATVAAIPSI